MGARPAVDTLREIRHGDFLEELDQELNALNADRAKDALFDDYLDTIREKTGLTIYV